MMWPRVALLPELSIAGPSHGGRPLLAQLLKVWIPSASRRYDYGSTGRLNVWKTVGVGGRRL